MTVPLLELDRVASFYGPLLVHFDLSIVAPEGRIVCLSGGNASGKSTTMKVILGVLKPRSGVVRFAGAAMRQLWRRISTAY
jgi:branched-chain amino acid transport system ATP-binding protein